MTERFAGLSLSQLVDLLHDLAEPGAIGMSPQTIGWQIVAAWLFAVLLIVAVHGLRRRRRNRYRREAAATLAELEKRLAVTPEACPDLGVLLKRTAMQAYSRERVASLYGDAWAKFLVETAADDALVRGAADDLARVAYRPPENLPGLVTAARRWIRYHRA